MNEIAIRAHNLGKRYWIGGERPADSLRESLTRAVARPARRALGLMRGHSAAALDQHEPLWALRGASFEVHRGEALGIIGRNGAGKSTLLKVLSRITAPTEGEAELTGRVASLLEVGTGFHPDLTGEENIFLNGSILGMSRKEIRAVFGQIVEFAGIGKFLKTPVKFYSSGMYTRLAFAVAAHLETEIMIIDEVLAVGDVEFQRRCFERMDDVAHSGRTVLFVSHNLAAVSNLCPRALLIDGGRITRAGPVGEVVESYLALAAQRSDQALNDREDRRGSGAVRLTGVRLQREGARDTAGQPQLIAGQPATIELHYQSAGHQLVNDLRAAVTITDFSGTRLFTCSTRFQGGHFHQAPPRGMLRCEIPALPLAPGRYRLDLWSAVAGDLADRIDDAVHFDVVPVGLDGTGQVPTPGKHGPILVPHHWSVDPR